jgi:nucleotide-binding universal stress UspA family protein
MIMTVQTTPDAAPIVILGAIEIGDTSDDVLRTVAMLGQTLPRVELHLVHVVQPPPADGGSGILLTAAELCARAQEALRAAVARVRERFAGEIAIHTSVGSPVHEILALAAELGVEFIVVGAHRKSVVERWALGSVSEKVVRKARCAVLVAKPNQHRATVPAIEPPCADCVALQRREGEGRWCAQHTRSRKHPRAHVHYEVPEPFALGSLLVRPDA